MTNQNKYIVEILNMNNANKIKKYKQFKNREDIATEYKLPLYIVNKVIKKYNFNHNENNKISKSQTQYKDIFIKMRIFIIKPTF
jgi:hypothetical protein